MKVLAGLNIRIYERAAHAVAEYNRTIERGLEIALRDLSEEALPPLHASGDKLAAIVFGSDQGMCGQLNDVVVAHASRALARLAVRREDQTTLAIGQRAAAQLEDAGHTVEATLEVPGSTNGIAATVHDVLLRIQDWRQSGIEMVVLFYCGLHSGTLYRPRGIRLLPVDREWIHSLRAKRWPSRVIPTYTMATEELFHSLIREYLFVSLFRAFAESLASENASRLASMQVAERNIEDRLKELSSEFRHSRQSSITSELLDIVAAFEALKGKGTHGRN
jgi:F-type H+-transporting ATPase subunit gamma